MSLSLTKLRTSPGYDPKNIKTLGPGTGANKGYTFAYDSSTSSLLRVKDSSGDYDTYARGTTEYNNFVGVGGFGKTIETADKEYSKRVTTAAPTSGAAVLSSVAVSSTGAKAARDSYPTSYYPESLATTKQDRIRFSMKVPGTRDITAVSASSGRLSGFGPRTTSSKSLGEVYIAVPSQITDSNTVDWSGSTMNPLQATMASLAINNMRDKSNTNFAKLLSSLQGQVMQNVKNFAQEKGNRQALQVLLAQEAVGAQGLLSRLSGVVANPNLELLFNGPQLRPFTFNFRMAPRNSSEAKQVKRIIRFFKEGMAVQTTDQDIFLKSPNVFDIQFQSGSSQVHKSLPRIKTCALIGCDVDYTPDGSYMTFNDAGEGYPMTCYQLSLRFSEIEPVYASDYKNISSEDDIGY